MVRDYKKVPLEGTIVDENENTILNLKDPVISFPYQCQSLSLNKELLSKHLLIMGGIGTGKTNVIHKIMKDLDHLDKDAFLMIFDTKGDYYRYYDPTKDILISTDKNYQGITNYYNIFKEISAYSSDQEEQRTFIREIAKAYFADRKNSSQPFFSNAAQQIFANILIGFQEGMFKSKKMPTKEDIFDISHSSNYLSNATIWEFFQNNSDEDIARLLRQCHFRNTESAIGDATSKQSLGVFGELRSMIEDYFMDAFHQSNSRKDISIIETVRKKGGVKIFIEYDLTKGQVLAPVYSLLFDFAFKEALGRKKSEGDCYFIIDELKLLPKLQHLEDALNFGRSLGVKCVCGIQNIHQIEEAYDEYATKSLLSGFMNIFCFYLLDYQTRQYLIDNFGKNYLDIFYYNKKEIPVNVQKEGNVVEDRDILSLERGQAIVKLDTTEPFIYKFGKYDD